MYSYEFLVTGTMDTEDDSGPQLENNGEAERIVSLERELINQREEFNNQRAKLKELYLSKEGEVVYAFESFQKKKIIFCHFR